jgi:O-antigen/teichoic acid export membrane protein
LSTPTALNIHYIRGEKGTFKTYAKSSFIFPFFCFVVVFICCLLFGEKIASEFEISAVWIYIIPVACFFKLFESTLVNQFIIRQKPIKFTFLTISSLLINIGLSLFLIIGLRMGYEGRLEGIFISVSLVGLYAIWFFWKQGIFEAKVNMEYAKDALVFGFPLIFHSLSHIAINSGDRIFIAKMTGNAELGVYQIGYTIGSLVMVLSLSFMNAWGPVYLEKLKEGVEQYKSIVKINYLFIGGIGFFLVVLCFLTPLLFSWFIDESYIDGMKYVFWVGLSYFFYAIYQVFSNVIVYAKKTKIFGWLACFNVALNCLLNYVLIKEYGTIGAAYATLVTFIFFAIIVGIVSNRIIALPWFSFYHKSKN